MSTESESFHFSAPIVSPDDPDANTIAAAIVGIEDQLGERQGWNRPAQLFTLRLLPGDLVETGLYPEHLWCPGGFNPIDALDQLAAPYPPVPDLLPPADAAQATVCAVGFMFETWTRDTRVALPPHLARRAQRGERVNHLAPTRREARTVHAVDLNQRVFHAVRARGEAQSRMKDPGLRSTSKVGAVPAAVARIMHAIRCGQRVLPGQPA
ncbi:hypothetical protein ACFXKW_32195 [Streptomyces sp. NPDC059193]|uniref:hypothetical protein n=1 Tax=Streptomyces sp. NPDC059193 TaxID=3346763 RepID=UPI0036CD749E